MICPTTNTLYQYRTVRPSLSTSHPPRLVAFDPSSHRRSTTGTANCIVSPALLLSCTLLSTTQTNPPIPCPHAWNRAANDGLRPKTYPPQRYLERADLTIFLYSMRAYFNHNISMRPCSVSITMTSNSRARPGNLNCFGELDRIVQAGRRATPISVCLLVLDGRERV